ncbi:hypothetical protein L323_03215 [Ruminiclostridium papyrosolvens C7]|uniref:Uncharacterized protein n=1 Tax=Ruminiclostridium papyrosolvens C7 TaxID=1330534 RepID=U4R6Q6_9FIRM|nr:hypothetical protein L323_03215 [Ruminiclostridium papyrosolvens C7]
MKTSEIEIESARRIEKRKTITEVPRNYIPQKKEAQPATQQVMLLFLRFHYNFVRYISKLCQNADK